LKISLVLVALSNLSKKEQKENESYFSNFTFQASKFEISALEF
jgi:hypothetical protein